MTTYRLSPLLSLALLALAASPAAAHITLERGEAAVGAPYKAVLKIPHGCDGSPTTSVTLEIPEGFIGVKPMPKAGWKTEVTKGPYATTYDFMHGTQLKDGVKSITWSGGELPDDFYDEFIAAGFIARELKAGDTLYFKVAQTCATGALNWADIPAEGVDAHSLKTPAATLKLVAAAGAGDHDHDHGHAHHAAETIGAIAIETPWARATPGGATVGAGYVTLRNTGSQDDALIGIEASFAAAAEVHEMSTTDGVMKMRQVTEGLVIPAGGSVALTPGGFHIMFTGLKSALVAGTPVKASFKFKSGAQGEVEFQVAPIGAGAPTDDHDHEHDHDHH